MYVEIRKAGFVNKGAELMLLAVMQQIELRLPSARMVMEPQILDAERSYLRRARLGLLQKSAFPLRAGLQIGDATALVPKKIRQMFGVVLDRELDVVLDAAGFAYSSQWGTRALKELEICCKRWARRRTTVVLLPQAFGPFKDAASQEAARNAFKKCDLIYARDRISYKYVADLIGESPNLRLSPDFTCMLEPVRYPQELVAGDICIVPNARMLDKTDAETSSQYVGFMARTIRHLRQAGRRPFLLIHEGRQDEVLANDIIHLSGLEIPIVSEDDPLRIKGIIADSKGMVGSRFHGLVSALCQGIPALATGWSHKYQMLFEDYGFPEGVLNLSHDDQMIEKSFSVLTDESLRQERARNLLLKAAQQKLAVERMWEEVFELISAKSAHRR